MENISNISKMFMRNASTVEISSLMLKTLYELAGDLVPSNILAKDTWVVDFEFIRPILEKAKLRSSIQEEKSVRIKRIRHQEIFKPEEPLG